MLNNTHEPESTDTPDSFTQQLELINCISGSLFVQQQHWVLVSNWSCPQHWWWLEFLIRIVLFGPQHSCTSLSIASVENVKYYFVSLKCKGLSLDFCFSSTHLYHSTGHLVQVWLQQLIDSRVQWMCWRSSFHRGL